MEILYFTFLIDKNQILKTINVILFLMNRYILIYFKGFLLKAIL